MRDILLLIVLVFLVFSIVRRPFIGVGLCIWTAMFYPNGWVFGLAGSVRYNLLFAGLTVFALITSKDKFKFRPGGLGSLILVFFAWTTLTTMLGIGMPEMAWESWSRFSKVIILFVLVVIALKRKLHFDFVMWALVFSLGFFAGLEALKYVASGGGHAIEGMQGHVLGDRNDLALAMAMQLPVCFYLLGEFGKRSWILKWGLLTLILLLAVAIIGTNSRGGMISLMTVILYLFIKSKRKLMFGFTLLVVGGIMAGMIPDEWYDRMNTIKEVEGDGSFMGRVVAWKMSYIIAMQNPIFGGGFKAVETLAIWKRLTLEFPYYGFFGIENLIPTTFARAPHSIFFQVLGDQGFIGLAMFIFIMAAAIFKTNRIVKRVRAVQGPEWIINLATMLRLIIIGYAVGGAALNFAYFDLIYAVYGLVIALENSAILYPEPVRVLAPPRDAELAPA